MISRAFRTLSHTIPLVLIAACAVNPATGERQLILMSESAEIEMGREADASITASMGLYDDPGLAAYVERIGLRLQATAERPDLPWTFRLVDDPIVNAFALPGGFVYITRGIMAHLNNEAQLAAVVGHEIGHVTGRHGAEQMSRGQLAQIGLGVGAMISPTAAAISNVAGAGLGLLFLRYGRDDERQADDLGLRYMSSANYDPREMPGVFTMLGRLSGGGEGGGIPSWLSTHPEPADRYERISAQIAQMGTDMAGQDVEADSYLDRLEGLVYGNDPRNGYFDGGLYLHPNMKFQVRFPEGWQTADQPQAVIAVSPDEDAVIQLTLTAGATPVTAVSTFLESNGIAGAARSTRVNGLDAATADFAGTTGDGSAIAGRIVVVSFGGSLFQLLGYGTDTGWTQHGRDVGVALTSFDRLTDPAALGIQPLRVTIATNRRTRSVAEFHAATPMEISVEELALINQLEVGDVLRSGARLKIVERGSP